MKDAIFCTTSSIGRADHIVNRLQRAGFMPSDISVVCADQRSTSQFAHEKHTKAPEGAMTGASAGGLVGGTLGLLAGIGALAVPGLGPLIAAGPIVATLSGAAVGAAAGGITGALVGVGLPEYEAKRYEGLVQKGNVLISVHVESRPAKARAVETLKHAGADDIAAVSESHVPQRKAS